MLLDKVEVRSERNELLTLSLHNPSEGFMVQDIDGLDPVKATIITSTFAGQDGTQYQASRRESRNPVFKMGVDPFYTAGTVGDLRKKLKRFFMPKAKVKLRFFTIGGPTVDIEGRVESFDFPLFVKAPTATISVICFDPDFYSLTAIEVSGFTTPTTTDLTIDYDGDIETGIEFTLNPDRELNGFVIEQRPQDNTVRQLEYSGEDLEAGDHLIINTVSGSKAARLMHDDTIKSVLYAISPYSEWLTLFPGTNLIRVIAEGEPIPYTLRYTTRFGSL